MEKLEITLMQQLDKLAAVIKIKGYTEPFSIDGEKSCSSLNELLRNHFLKNDQPTVKPLPALIKNVFHLNSTKDCYYQAMLKVAHNHKGIHLEFMQLLQVDQLSDEVTAKVNLAICRNSDIPQKADTNEILERGKILKRVHCRRRL